MVTDTGVPKVLIVAIPGGGQLSIGVDPFISYEIDGSKGTRRVLIFSTLVSSAMASTNSNILRRDVLWNYELI